MKLHTDVETLRIVRTVDRGVRIVFFGPPKSNQRSGIHFGHQIRISRSGDAGGMLNLKVVDSRDKGTGTVGTSLNNTSPAGQLSINLQLEGIDHQRYGSFGSGSSQIPPFLEQRICMNVHG